MADGTLKISPSEARAKAEGLRKTASDLEDLLNKVSTKMEEINSVEEGVYQGDNRPAQLKAELDEFRTMFDAAHEQIVKFSNYIDDVANRAENE